MTARQNKILKRRLSNQRERQRVRDQRPGQLRGIVLKLHSSSVGGPYTSEWRGVIVSAHTGLRQRHRVDNHPYRRKSLPGITFGAPGQEISTFAPRGLNERLLGEDLVLVRGYHRQPKRKGPSASTRIVKILDPARVDLPPE
ncbi:hypothetical protein [Streptomyces sp. 5-6(2022)]|uniref:hypothetical protein n=1 Tax=Streptomyces sp. 5-6(2022) TaxID=2936510 RepID=UPI0023B8B008|nr:hypothetical protein [Streptomyces sp. 5-6(2022)]